MNFNLTKQTKPIVLFALTVALLGGVCYGGYRYWQSQQAVSESQEPEEPIEERAYEIIDNPDGNHTFVCYKFGFEFNYPEGWEFSEKYSSVRYDDGWVEIFSKDGERSVLISAWAPRDQTRYPMLRDSLIEQDGLVGLSLEPNFAVAGLPAFKYGLLERSQASDVVQVVFESNDHVFAASTAWNNRDDPEYTEILNSFKLVSL